MPARFTTYRQTLRAIGRVQRRRDVGHRAHVVAVDRLERVAEAHARAIAREAGRDVVGDDDVVAAPRPQHAVVELAHPRLDERDVHDRHADQSGRHRHGQGDADQRAELAKWSHELGDDQNRIWMPPTRRIGGLTVSNSS